MPRSRAIVAATLLLGVSLLSGCRATQKLALTPSGAPAFERFVAEYEIPAADVHLGREFAADEHAAAGAADEAGIQRVSAAQSSPPVAIQSATLQVECPAPSGADDEALLTVRIQAGAAASSRRSVTRVGHLIVPRQQVELLILDLARAGFFEDTVPPGDATQLSVSIDGARVAHAWPTDDRLLDFAHRVLHRGQLTTQ